MAGDADFEATMDLVMKKIYTSCDLENTDEAPVSLLIEFIKPYMLQDLSALDHLKALLDPNNEDVCVSSDTFYSAMAQWAKKVANPESEEFSETSTCNLDFIDEKELPFTQSTPRTSFGQKLLSSENLLNISGASANFSLIPFKENTVGKCGFEEEINRLEHQLNKCSNELKIAQKQLASSEEQNEVLQADLERCRVRLLSEQQLNEHLEKNKVYCEELNKEICQSKKEVESLQKKLHECEKDKNYLSTYMKGLEQEIAKLEDRCKEYEKCEEKLKSELVDIRAELEHKEQNIVEINKLNEELKTLLDQNKTRINDLTSENNELIDYRAHNLEKNTARRFSSSTAYAPQLSGSLRDIGSEEELSFGYQTSFGAMSPCQSLQAELFQVSRIDIDIPKEEAVRLKQDNERLRNRVDELTKETDRLYDEITKLEDNIEVLEKETKKNTLNKEELEKYGKDILIKSEQAEEGKKLVEELQKKLQDLENEYLQLQTKYSAKEKEVNELSSKFDFEAAYKHAQIELNAKCELLSALQKECECFKTTICKLTHDNKKLKTSLEELNEKLKDKEQVWKLNEDIEGMTNQVQLHIEKKTEFINELAVMKDSLKNSVEVLEDKLRDRDLEVQHLAEVLKGQDAIKNIMWRDNKELADKLEAITEEKKKLLEEVCRLRDDTDKMSNVIELFTENNKTLCEEVKRLNGENKELTQTVNEAKLEYDTVLIKYNNEVKQVGELSRQIEEQTKELTLLTNEYKDQSLKNVKLQKCVKALKSEILNVQDDLKENKVRICNMLSDFKHSVLTLDITIKILEGENSSLKQELAEKKKELELCDKSLEPKKLSFEKQMIAMDRLKEKVDILNEELEAERSSKADLQEKLNGVERLYRQTTLECEGSKNIAKDMQHKATDLMKQIDYYKKTETENKQKIEELLFKINQKETHIKLNIDTIDDLRTKTEQLQAQLHEMNLHKNQLLVELKNKDSLCNSLHIQNENLNQLLEVSSKTCVELNLKLNEQSALIHRSSATIANLTQTLNEKDKTIDMFKVTVIDLQQKLASQQTDLDDKEKSLRKLLEENNRLQEVKELQKNYLDLTDKIEAGKACLRAVDEELNELNHKVSSSREELNVIQKETDAKVELIYQCNKELSRIYNILMDKWGSNLQIDVATLPQIKECNPSEIGLYDLYNNITCFIAVLQVLMNRVLLPDVTETAAEQLQSAISDSKPIKKFTLRPARFTVRSVSPDSSCLEPGTSTALVVSPSKTVLQDRTLLNSSLNNVNLSADSQAFDARPNPKDSTICDVIDLPEVCMQTNIIFPHVTDRLLDKLGLHENMMTLSRQEIEKIFCTFAVHVDMDCGDVKERLHKQKEQCEKYHRKCFCLINEMSVLLKSHRCPRRNESIEPAVVLLESFATQLQKTLQSAGQMGMLACEDRMAVCWKLVTSYISVLKNDIETDQREQQIATEVVNTKDQNTSTCSLQVQLLAEKRHKFFDKLKMALFWVFLFALLFIALLNIHWCCQIDANHEICLLDFLIQRIQIGNPPY